MTRPLDEPVRGTLFALPPALLIWRSSSAPCTHPRRHLRPRPRAQLPVHGAGPTPTTARKDAQMPAAYTDIEEATPESTPSSTNSAKPPKPPARHTRRTRSCGPN